MSIPVFQNYCIDWEYVLKDMDFNAMLRRVEKQAKTEEAKKRVDFANYKDYEPGDWAPMYFGSFTEWFSFHWLVFFGGIKWDVGNPTMYDVVGGTNIDLGIDGVAYTTKIRTPAKGSIISPVVGSKVYLQVKGCLDPFKIHTPNDGTRLPNFLAFGLSTAIIRDRDAYRTRLLLITTGAGIHRTLLDMSNGMLEVINRDDITKLANVGNFNFLNYLRRQAGISSLEMPSTGPDTEAQRILLEHKKLEL